MDSKEKTKSQWYSTDNLDPDVDFQNWETNGKVNAPNYVKAYDKMMDDVPPDDSDQEE
mgnify:CR=1 FL=1